MDELQLELFIKLVEDAERRKRGDERGGVGGMGGFAPMRPDGARVFRKPARSNKIAPNVE